MIRAYVYDNYLSGGFSVGVSVVLHPAEGAFDVRPRVLRLGGNEQPGLAEWEEIPADGSLGEPTMRLDNEVARAVLDALTAHFHGAEDTRALRRDYDAERKRVNELTGHLAVIARTLAEVP